MRPNELTLLQSGVKQSFKKWNAKAQRKKQSVKKFKQTKLLAERMENGLDLWSGQPLSGLDADNWVRIQDQMSEQEPVLTPTEVSEQIEVFEVIDWSPMAIRGRNLKWEKSTAD